MQHFFQLFHSYIHTSSHSDNLNMFLRVSVLLLILDIICAKTAKNFPHLNHRNIYQNFCLISCTPILGREKLKTSKSIAGPEWMKLPLLTCSHKWPQAQRHKGLKAMEQVTMPCQSHDSFELSMK